MANLDLKDRAQQKLAEALVELGIYRHWRGGLYTLFTTSIDEETLEPLVHYYSHVKKTRTTRRLSVFREAVKEVGYEGPRFEFTCTATTAELCVACFGGAE